MRRLFILVLLAPIILPLHGTADVPVQNAKPEAPAKKPTGNLYFVAIGQQQNWKFLPDGFDRVMKDQVFATQTGSVRPREIKSKLAKLPCQAIVVNDACQSGNWPKEFEDDKMPDNVTALCCCLSTQDSGIEFDITLFEALYGKADFNKDGVVDLDEVIKYCELRIREVQGGRLTPVLHKAKSMKKAIPLTKANPDLVSVVHRKEIFSAVVEKRDGDDFDVRVIGFDKPGNSGLGGGTVPNKFKRENVILPGDGAALMVRKDMGWHPAILLSKMNDEFKIRYVGTDGDVAVKGENVRHLFAGNAEEKIPTGLFKKN
jgi:hypothetical protein